MSNEVAVKQVVKTMSSVEIVKVINELREPGSAVLQHKHFLVKAERLLGEAGPNFRLTYTDAQGREKPYYYIPEFEARSMVFSESKAVRDKVLSEMMVTKPVAPDYSTLPQNFAYI